MLDAKLIKTIQVLTSRELLDLERQLAAPFVNPTEDVAKLFSLLCKHYPAFDNEKLTKEWLFRKLYGKTPYNDGKLRKLMTLLTQGIERYLIQKELWKSEELQAKLLAKAMGERENHELFQATIVARMKTLEAAKDRGRSYYREHFELAEMLLFYPGVEDFKNKDEVLKSTIVDFEQYFTLVMLQNQANSIVRNRLVRTDLASSFLQYALQIAAEPAFGRSETVPFFSKLVALLGGQLEMDIEQLRGIAFSAIEQMSHFERDFSINLLRNYAVPMANQGSIPHKRFVFELYKLEMEEGFFANSIPSSAFMNMTATGLTVGEIQWAEQFVEKYSHYIPANEREITVNYCRGITHYHKGVQSQKLSDFYNALQCMNLIPIRTGPQFEIRVRPMLLRIHFEIFEKGKEDVEEMLNHVRNFERHLSGNNDYSESMRVSHLLFLRYFKRFIRLMDNPNKLDAEFLQKFIVDFESEKAPIVLKPWLVEKARGLAQLS